jgi:hypothetical protein
VCHFQILAIREFGFFSARRLMGQLSQVGGIALKWFGWYKEFTKEDGDLPKFEWFGPRYEGERQDILYLT